MDVGVSLLQFKYPATLKKFTRNVAAKLYFPKLCFQGKYILFHKQKIKVKNFIVVVELFVYFSLVIFPPFQCLSVSLAM